MATRTETTTEIAEATGSCANLTISGNQSKTSSLTWTKPTLPSGATITSVKIDISYKCTMSKQNCTVQIPQGTIHSGGQSTKSTSLTLANNVASPITVTYKGGNKNSSGTFTWNSIKITYTYTVTGTIDVGPVCWIKLNGQWVESRKYYSKTKYYVKENGQWVGKVVGSASLMLTDFQDRDRAYKKQ